MCTSSCFFGIIYGGDYLKVAIIGSRSLKIRDFTKFLPANTTEIVSGGARGIDLCARNYAITHGIKLTEFLPDYKTFGKIAPLLRNNQIVEYSDMVLGFWDGKSTGTANVIKRCRNKGVPFKLYKLKKS